MNNTYEIEDFNSFYEVIKIYSNKNYIFRGEENSNFENPLKPKIARQSYNKDNEIEMFNEFKRLATPYINYNMVDINDDFEILTIAQHYGLPTRLLDWSRNPLVSAYFSTCNYYNVNNDSAIYILNTTSILNANTLSLTEKKDILISDDNLNVLLYYPKHITSRVTVQDGLFTYHDDPTTNLIEYIKYNNETAIMAKTNPMIKTQEIELNKIVIKKSFQEELFNMLNLFGYNKATLFPDLGGIAGHLSWKYKI